jgi:6-phosphogluconolactonase
MRIPLVLRNSWLAAASICALGAVAHAQTSGLVVTQTNFPGGNSVMEFERAPNGQLTFVAFHATGGLGTGADLGSQGSVVLNREGRLLFVVNAGSDTVSVFRLETTGWRLIDIEPSLGDMPVSIATMFDRVYVLNAGAPANVAAFRLSGVGELDPIPGSVQPLSATDPAPAQVGIGPGGGQVFVTEKATNTIGIFPVAEDGALGPGTFLESSGQTPFGFGFAPTDTLIVSEAFNGAIDASAVSSYRIGPGSLQVISPSVPTTETAACWIVVTREGRFAYSSNADSGSVSGFEVSEAGELTLLDLDGVTGFLGPGSHPIDEALSRDSQWLYVLSPTTQEIAIFHVEPDGSLVKHRSQLRIPATAVGLAAR